MRIIRTEAFKKQAQYNIQVDTDPWVAQQKRQHPQMTAWVLSTLSNDEYSSDEQLVSHFMQEGPMSKEDAERWVAKRDFYLNNIVLQQDQANRILNEGRGFHGRGHADF